MPTTYFHTAGLVVGDLDCGAALLPSIFFSPPSPTGQQRLHSESRAWQSDRTTEHVTEWHTEGQKTTSLPFSSLLLIFLSSTVFLILLCNLHRPLYLPPEQLLWGYYIKYYPGMRKALIKHRNCFVFNVCVCHSQGFDCDTQNIMEVLGKWYQETELTNFPLTAWSKETGASLSVCLSVC